MRPQLRRHWLVNPAQRPPNARHADVVSGVIARIVTTGAIATRMRRVIEAPMRQPAQLPMAASRVLQAASASRAADVAKSVRFVASAPSVVKVAASADRKTMFALARTQPSERSSPT